MKTAYITTPIYYVNDVPHIGHYYSSIVADVCARSYFLSGYNVRSQTGTDEHGQKILRSAEAKGVNPMKFCNEISEFFRQMTIDSNCMASYGRFDLSNFNNQDGKFGFGVDGENFIRTTEGRDLETGEITDQSRAVGRHVPFVEKFWQTLEANGYIYKSKYSGWYAVRDEAFYTESELVDGKAPTGAEVEFKTEECYFFKLSAFQKILLAIFLKNKDLIKPHQKYTEVLSFLSGLNFEKASHGFFKPDHLQDLCISRQNLPWGIPIEEGQSVYVWLDALTNYLSALSEKRDIFWSNRSDESVVTHIVGKDILRFHAVFWPAFLIAEKIKYSDLLGMVNLAEDTEIDGVSCFSNNGIDAINSKIDGKILFDRLFAHGWWTNNGEKISKSLKNTIDPIEEIGYLVAKILHNEKKLDEVLANFDENTGYIIKARCGLLDSGEIGFDKIAKNLEIDEVEARSIYSKTIAKIAKSGDFYGTALDCFRYFLLRSMPFGNDGNYSRKLLVETVNADLVNNIGNLTQRTISMAKKYCSDRKFVIDKKLADRSCGNLENISNLYQNLDLTGAINEVLKIAMDCNALIDRVAPWKIAKEDRFDEIFDCLLSLCVDIYTIAIGVSAVCASISESILKNLGIDFAIFNTDLIGLEFNFRENIVKLCPRI